MRYRSFTTDVEHLPAIRAWGQKLMTIHKQEALETLKQERVIFEGMYELKGDPHTIFCLMEGECLPSDPTNSLNQEHYKILALLKPCETLPPSGEMHVIYELALNA